MQNLTKEEQKIRAKASVAKMQIEEYAVAISQLKHIAMSLFLFAIILLLSTLLFEARNWPFIIISIITGGIVIAFRKQFNWSHKSSILIGMFIFIGSTIIECLFFGLPDPLIANLERGPRIVVILNALSPFLYPGLKLFLVFPFFSMLNYKNKLSKHPKAIFDYLKDSEKIPQSLQYLMPY